MWKNLVGFLVAVLLLNYVESHYLGQPLYRYALNWLNPPVVTQQDRALKTLGDQQRAFDKQLEELARKLEPLRLEDLKVRE